MKKNILITGIPRSGTSLFTKLLSTNENFICFSEPSWLKALRFEGQTIVQFSDALHNKFESIRNEIKKGNPIKITTKKGTKELPDNYYIRKGRNITNVKNEQYVHFEHNESLTIVAKSNTLFTSCLDSLSQNQFWHIYAVTRDPLYTLLSWNSLNIPISKGLIKIGEVYSNQIREIVKTDDILKRQILIYNWFTSQFKKYNCDIIKYEELSNSQYAQYFLDNFHIDTSNISTNNTLQRYELSNIVKIKSYLTKYLQESKHNSND